VSDGRAHHRFVVPEACGEREQALSDAGHHSTEGAGGMALEGGLFLERLNDRLDPMPGAAERAEARCFVLSVWTHEPAAVVGDELLELTAREALVGEHDAALDRDALEDLGGRPARPKCSQPACPLAILGP
jgi:hypothetical protein